MKTTKNLAMGLGLIAAVAAVSCSDYDAIDEAAIKHEAAVKEYSQNFVSYFGQPDPNHTWGFGKAATRGNYSNKNQWVNTNEDIPGWPTPSDFSDPDLANQYQWANGNGDTFGWESTEPVFDGSKVPGGDVTAEEIAYVSWWFRTHKNPTSDQLPKENFYIQGISADNDRQLVANENDGGALTKGVAITSAPIYELQQDGTYQVTGTRPCEMYSVDYLSVKGAGDNGEWVDVKDMNYSNSNHLTKATDLWSSPTKNDVYICNYRNENDQVTSIGDLAKGRIMDFYWSMDTNNFRVWNSGTASYDDTWALVHLTFDINGHHYDGWYLAFDLEYYAIEEEAYMYVKPDGTYTTVDGEYINYTWDHKDENNQGVFVTPEGEYTYESGKYVTYEQTSEKVVKKYAYMPHDGYYSNWIFKLSPSDTNPDDPTVSRRIFCEDLGNTFDFDFNDVVFDAEWTAEKPNEIAITVQAAGGTMRIDVAGKDIKNEWGVEYDQPVNVGMGVTKDPFTFTINVSNITTKDEALAAMKNIAITAHGEDGIYNISGNNYQDKENADNNTNSAPFVFAVPAKIRWTKEYQPIDEAYKNFKKWVENEAGNSTWYATDTDNSKLY